jgi:hypothetical protein
VKVLDADGELYAVIKPAKGIMTDDTDETDETDEASDSAASDETAADTQE